MNFSDKYKQDMEDQTTSEEATQEQFEQFLKDAITKQIFSQQQPISDAQLREAMIGLATGYIEVVEMFLDRLKGRLPYKYICTFILKFFDTVNGGGH